MRLDCPKAWPVLDSRDMAKKKPSRKKSTRTKTSRRTTNRKKKSVPRKKRVRSKGPSAASAQIHQAAIPPVEATVETETDTEDIIDYGGES